MWQDYRFNFLDKNGKIKREHYFKPIPLEAKYIDCSTFLDPSMWNAFDWIVLSEKAKLYGNVSSY